MKTSWLFVASCVLLLCQYAVAQPAAAAVEQRGVLSTQQRVQRASGCKGKLNGQAKQVAKQFCLAYLHGRQPQHSTVTSVVPATVTTTPVVTVQSTSVATEHATTISTEIQPVTNSLTITATTTAFAVSATTTTTTSTQTSSAPLPQQRRRRGTTTFAQQLANSFPSEVIADACLLYLYNTLAYPVVTVSTTATSTATAADAITVVSSTATTTTATETDTVTVPSVTVDTITASATTTQTSTTTSVQTVTATTTVSGELYYSNAFRMIASLAGSPKFDYSHTAVNFDEALLGPGDVPMSLYGYGYPANAANGDSNTDIRAGYLRVYGRGLPEVVFDPAVGKLFVSQAPQYVPQGYDRVYCTRPSAAFGVQLSCHGYASTTYTTLYACPNTVAGQPSTMYLLPAGAAPSGCTQITFTTSLQ